MITGDVGVSPGAAIVGFPPGIVVGAQHAADAVALQAQSDLVTPITTASAGRRTPSSSATSAVKTLVAGVYNTAGSAGSDRDPDPRRPG